MQGTLGPTANLGMASPGFTAVKGASASRFLLILPVKGKKVKGIGPGSLEILTGSREEEPRERKKVPTGADTHLITRRGNVPVRVAFKLYSHLAIHASVESGLKFCAYSQL